MYILIIIVITVIAILITVAVLLQAGRGGGLAGIGGGGQATQILGARQAPDFLEKATWTLGTAFIVLCILANFFAGAGDAPRSVIEGAEVPIEQPLPGGPGTIQDDFLPPAGPGTVAPPAGQEPGTGSAPPPPPPQE
jgi:preprotein translocase subunit SecG